MTFHLPAATQCLLVLLLSFLGIYVVYHYHTLVLAQVQEINKLKTDNQTQSHKIADDAEIITRQFRNFRSLESRFLEAQAHLKITAEKQSELERTCSKLRVELKEGLKVLDSGVFVKRSAFEEDADLSALTWDGRRYLLVLTEEEVDVWKRGHVKGSCAKATSWTCERFRYVR